MSRETLKTLFHPFLTEVLPMPGKGKRYLFLGAEAGEARPAQFEADIDCIQSQRPQFLKLQSTGARVRPDIAGSDYDGALILAGRHRAENENFVAEAMHRVKPDGWVVIAGSKEDGIQSLRKRLHGLGLQPEHMPKFHGVAVWVKVPSDPQPIAEALSAREVLVEGLFHTAPGMFSHERIDEGSEMLASRLPTDFDGNAADFGAAWGYLSAMLAARAPRTASIDLFEADYAALEAAKQNMSEGYPAMLARFHWHDLVGEPVKSKFDLIMMNPPFHQGRAAEPGLGQAFIRTAAASLRPGGSLMLVANRGLPYEAVLAENFKSHGETCRNARFKLLWGKR
ncbi:class I SAM-dependent methyltransferase [Ciceribacter sp. L1K22]|uniref:class I SAM-dependent methyltransferase n=1 Tax=Ciceribacter sp. L1K22 TaxID=2820275 RepID=UPI001ABEC18C|nr:class I SAM-dependent methyltransferase [Ciceribacter sp. L1K22]MBO3758497.1 class I SAM-dependent methyltransferase [Ciceribacter sp. L1K22]